MSVSDNPNWQVVSTYIEDDDGETVEKAKECDLEGCEGAVYSNRGELVCGACSTVLSEDAERHERSFYYSEWSTPYWTKERSEYEHSGRVRMIGGYRDAYLGNGDYELGSYDDDGLTVHHLRDWSRN